MKNKKIKIAIIGLCCFSCSVTVAQIDITPGNPAYPEEILLPVQDPAVQTNQIMGDTNLAGSSVSAMTLGETPSLYTDSLALVELYNSTNGDNWTNKTNWKTGNVSTWFGIVVSGARVIRVDLRNNNLTGTIPSSIGNLTLLNRLILSQNSIEGTIPETIGNLTGLQQLLLDFNRLTGNIPSSTSALTALTHFYVYRNQLTGDLPNLSGLTQMRILAFHVNDLTGNFDWIGNMPQMTEFYYYVNPNLDCTIPASIGNLTNLTLLAGGGWLVEGYVHTKIHGPLPAELGNCTKLQRIYLDNSEFSGDVPATFKNLVNLRQLYIFNNENLSGSIESFTSGLTKIENFSVSRTKITGSIPASMASVNLKLLDLSWSAVTGPLPSFLTNATNLTQLHLDSLQLTAIPDWSSSFPLLISLRIQNNKLQQIPNFGLHPNKSNLSLYVHNNKLDFADFEPHYSAASVNPFSLFSISPQAEVGVEQTVMWSTGTVDSLVFPISGVHSAYQWQKKNLNNEWLDIAGATRRILVREPVAASDSGQYRIKITNAWVTGLTLYSKPTTVLTTCIYPTVEFTVEKVNAGYVFTPIVSQLAGCNLSYNWNFGDDSYSSESNPYHLFRSVGTKTISLTASFDCNGCPLTNAIASKEITIEGLCGDIFCTPDGNISIGYPVGAAGYKLSVNGKMIIEGAHLALHAKWPDYVFDASYQQIPLSELKQYIDANKHLPGIPSAGTVQKEGIDVVETSRVLVEKTEELYLYLIQLNERLKKLERND